MCPWVPYKSNNLPETLIHIGQKFIKWGSTRTQNKIDSYNNNNSMTFRTPSTLLQKRWIHSIHMEIRDHFDARIVIKLKIFSFNVSNYYLFPNYHNFCYFPYSDKWKRIPFFNQKIGNKWLLNDYVSKKKLYLFEQSSVKLHNIRTIVWFHHYF